MRILLAPDKFKGSFTAEEICDHLRAGILEARPSAEVIAHPLADGGEGTLSVLLGALGGRRVAVGARGPLGAPIQSDVGLLADGSVVIESSLFCGLQLVEEDRRDPMAASSFGLGLALREVLSWNPPEVLVGLGGSATVDCGFGLARALGWRFLSEDGSELRGGGGDLERIASLSRPPGGGSVARGPRIRALCDVENPLTGKDGAAEVFAAQKGASAREIKSLAAGLKSISIVIERDLGVPVTDLPRGGSAGGLGAGMHAFVGADLEAGAAGVLDRTRFDACLEGIDWVVTGEGSFDAGSLRGKVLQEVVKRAFSRNIPVVAICGRIETNRLPVGVQFITRKGVVSSEVLRQMGRILARQEASGRIPESEV